VPCHATVPASGRRNIESRRSSVVFPVPDGPTTVRTSPLSTPIETSSTTASSPYPSETPSVVSVMPTAHPGPCSGSTTPAS
jgi:hypothetical protein